MSSKLLVAHDVMKSLLHSYCSLVKSPCQLLTDGGSELFRPCTEAQVTSCQQRGYNRPGKAFFDLIHGTVTRTTNAALQTA